jgi:thioredoxin reductase (NADPH)
MIQADQPSNRLLNQQPIYDLIIVGAGPAGMAASIYASRYKINHLIFDDSPGGQGTMAGQKAVENYPGFASIPAVELMKNFIDHVASYGVEIKSEKIGELRLEEKDGKKRFSVKTQGNQYFARSLILAMGGAHRHLNIAGEEKLISKGVSYCTICDAPFFKDKTVAVVGGGDAAVFGAVHVASFAQKVYIIHRRDEFRAEPIWVEKLKQNPKIEQILSTQVLEIKGQEQVEEIVLDKPYEGSLSLKVDGVFIEIGQVPSSTLATQLGVGLDEKGGVKINVNMETNIPGVFAAGDLAIMEGERPLRQIVIAASQGARTAASVYNYLNQQHPAPSW